MRAQGNSHWRLCLCSWTGSYVPRSQTSSGFSGIQQQRNILSGGFFFLHRGLEIVVRMTSSERPRVTASARTCQSERSIDPLAAKDAVNYINNKHRIYIFLKNRNLDVILLLKSHTRAVNMRSPSRQGVDVVGFRAEPAQTFKLLPPSLLIGPFERPASGRRRSLAGLKTNRSARRKWRHDVALLRGFLNLSLGQLSAVLWTIKAVIW